MASGFLVLQFGCSQKSLQCMCSPQLCSEANGVHHSLSGTESDMHVISQGQGFSLVMYYFGWKSVYVFPLCHFDYLLQISWIHCLVCGSFLLIWKFCSLTCQHLGFPQTTEGHWQLINLTFLDHIDGGCTQSKWYLGSKDSRIRYNEGHLIFVIAPNLLPPEPLWWHNPRVRRILLWNYLYQGCHWSGHSNDQCPKNKPKWSLRSLHWWLSHYPKSLIALTINPDPGYVFRSMPLI